MNSRPTTLPDTATLDELREDEACLDLLLGIAIHPDLPRTRSGLPRVFRIRFLDENDRELPGTMTLGAFRVLAEHGKAKLVIDDGSGGKRVSSPEPELV